MWKILGIGIVLSVASAGASMAQSSLGQNSPTVDLGPGTFAVVDKWNTIDDDLWCSAAKGALQRGASWRDRIYVSDVAGAGQSQFGAEAITFTFRPSQEQLAQSSVGSGSVRGIGNNLTLRAANRRCRLELEYYSSKL
ncbi:hypothetical protein BXY66_1989 [Shimia isoporae]|uniref:Uncharacterized protein n=1 Tax=Shimia isoporae TaxID=647720 RepID=A0A4R1NXL3_9RHOB|nr:hypothetical protein [Shimia isoporae]TCL09922.1 hypothetical protein BXY66_1989 [Shimia isoporae]